MDHEADVGFVDAHAERICGHNHLLATTHEVVLRLDPDRVAQAGVIHRDAEAGIAQLTADLFDRLSRRVINNPRATDSVCETFDVCDLFALSFGVDYFDREIGTIETADERL